MATVMETAAQLLEISGDVEASAGAVEAPGDVTVGGSVLESATLRSSGNVAIQGGISAATVEAAGEIRVQGGINTRHRGQVLARGGLSAKYCDEADVSAGGDIVVGTGVINSDLEAGGRLLIEQGALVGGRSYAREGAALKALGNDAHIKTHIAIGVFPGALADARRLEKTLKKQKEASARIREAVQPLMAQLKRLTPTQRERATELLYQADSIDAQIREQTEKQAAVLAAHSPTGEAALQVNDRIYPGVTVVFGDRSAVIQQERTGPLRIVRRQVGRVEEIIIEELETGVTTTLNGFEYAADAETGEPRFARITAPPAP